jgi:uncharacterized membrane protein
MSSSIFIGVFLLSLLFNLVYGIRKKNKMVIGISAVLLLITVGVIGSLIYTLEHAS